MPNWHLFNQLWDKFATHGEFAAGVLAGVFLALMISWIADKDTRRERAAHLKHRDQTEKALRDQKTVEQERIAELHRRLAGGPSGGARKGK